MADLRRCTNPECRTKWNREAMQECPGCGQPDRALSEPPVKVDRVVTVADAATMLEISQNAVRRRIRAGTLKAKKSGQRWLVYLPAWEDSADRCL